MSRAKSLICLLLSVFSGTAAVGLPEGARSQEWQHPPRLYFKPPNRILPDGTHADWPVTLPQITTDFLATLPPAATDVQLLFYWSQICPDDADHCDFSIVDDALHFWAQHGKQVILGFQTISYPTKVIDNGGPAFTQATPDWVLRGVQTFTHHTRTIGQAHLGSGAPSPEMDAAFPVNWSHPFVADVQHFIDLVAARYDGNPTISSMQMTLGLNGEDLAFPNMPDLSVQNWVEGFERPIVARYLQDFRKTPLEFDMALLGFLRMRAVEMANRDEVMAVDAFVDHLIQNHILISMQGLSGQTLTMLRQAAQRPDVVDLNYLLTAQRAGDVISLEALRPLTGPQMNDLSAMVAAIRTIRPYRLGLFNPAENNAAAPTRELLRDLGYQ